MGIYDLNNIHYLKHDVDAILSKVNEMYFVQFGPEQSIYISKKRVDNKVHWTSEVCKEAFNAMIPGVKSLVKDMYAVIEVIFKSKTGTFQKLILEKKYSLLQEFRLLNNKFKHHDDREAEINLTELVMMDQQVHIIDVYINFKYPDRFNAVRVSDLIDTFLKIMEDENVIEINRSRINLPQKFSQNNYPVG
jgi:hypothetical protein